MIRRSIGVVAALLAAVVALSACTPATVCDRRKTAAGKYQIRYQSEVDPDGGGKKTSDWITIDKDEYDRCKIGTKWPSCKKAPANEPRRDRKREDQDRNARSVCFDFVSEPKRKLTYRWRTPRREEGPRTGTWGIYSKCVDAQVGQVVNMKVEHVTGPSTLLCTIYIVRKGKKVPIDMMITQAYGDCDVSAVVPPN